MGMGAMAYCQARFYTADTLTTIFAPYTTQGIGYFAQGAKVFNCIDDRWHQVFIGTSYCFYSFKASGGFCVIAFGTQLCKFIALYLAYRIIYFENGCFIFFVSGEFIYTHYYFFTILYILIVFIGRACYFFLY